MHMALRWGFHSNLFFQHWLSKKRKTFGAQFPFNIGQRNSNDADDSCIHVCVDNGRVPLHLLSQNSNCQNNGNEQNLAA